MKNPMLNEDFLLELEKDRNREVYARIILLDVNELPIEQIEGKVISGSINIDGTSVVRRTCSLQLVSNNVNAHDFYWGIKNKFKLEVGLLNTIDTEYPDIIWFKQGIYVITAFSATLGVNNYTISISGKDKMCLLNGDMAGHIMNISEDFGVKWYWQNNEHTEYIAEDILIKEIIYKGVQTYAGELPQNIIINDIAECGVQLMEYRGKQPLYLIKNNDDKIYENMTVNGGMACWYYEGDNLKPTEGSLSTIPNYEKEISSEINQSPNAQPTIVYLQDPGERPNTSSDLIAGSLAYTIYKVIGGTGAIGYRLTDLTYAGELMAQAGDAFTSILDKIVDMLGNFEYFYDLDGHFVFQKKKNYITSKWTGLTGSSTNEENITYAEDNTSNDTFSYIFDGNYFITNFSSQPALANMRNDFSAWGVRTSATGAEIPVHMRMAIDDKPQYYKSFNGVAYYTKNISQKITKNDNDCLVGDWREIIYQMALDYYKNNSQDDFYVKLRQNNTIKINGEITQLYPDGRTGYERYYTDMEAFWRQLYIPDDENKLFKGDSTIGENTDVTTKNDTYYIWQTDKNGNNGVCNQYSFTEATSLKEIIPGAKYRYTTNNGQKYYYLIGYQPKTPYYHSLKELYDLTQYDTVDQQLYIGGTPFGETLEENSNILPCVEQISTTATGDYYTINVGNSQKTLKVGQQYLVRDVNKHCYRRMIPVPIQNNTDNSIIYAIATLKNGTPVAQQTLDASHQFSISVDADSIIIGAFRASGAQLIENENKELKEGQGALLQSANDVLVPIDGSNHWVVPIKDMYYYDSYQYKKIDKLSIKENQVFADNNFVIQKTLKLGESYRAFKVFPAIKDNYNEKIKMDDILQYFNKTSVKFPLYYKTDDKEKKIEYLNNDYEIATQFSPDGSQNYDSYKWEIQEREEWKPFFIRYYKHTGEHNIYYKNKVNEATDPWNPTISTNPEMLNFWIDFIDPVACGLEKYSARQIGPRPKVVNENSVKAIYYREVPNILFEEPGTDKFTHQPGYTYIYLNDSLKNLFVMSGQGISAKDKIEELLNNYTFMAEGVQISGVPIYRLDANTRISVKDIETGISGEYIISRISVPLGHNGTMSITASKAIELIY